MKDWSTATLAEVKDEFQRGFHEHGNWDPDAFPRAYELITALEEENTRLKKLAEAMGGIMNHNGKSLTIAFKEYDAALAQVKALEKEAEQHEISFT